VEWAVLGIRVNALASGIVAPEPERSTADGASPIDRLAARTPMRRRARPEEIAAAALFLGGTRAGFMTGQVLRVDGGWAALNSAVTGFVFP
jgi:NAD(P)-dependent dehydrogenase (short-subunit alcohol dehydrogenase family)